ncbi:MAG: zinc ribbon domain-containing protein [Candidatus Kapaibacterium sp.]
MMRHPTQAIVTSPNNRFYSTRCSSCGSVGDQSATVCPACGGKMRTTCPKCRTLIRQPVTAICLDCGSSFVEEESIE